MGMSFGLYFGFTYYLKVPIFILSNILLLICLSFENNHKLIYQVHQRVHNEMEVGYSV